MDSPFRVLRLRAQVYFTTLKELPEPQKQEPIDIITASNFNHLIDDLASCDPSIESALPAKVNIDALGHAPVSYQEMENLETEILNLIPETQETDRSML
ncbi:hypothetical protein Pan110_18080 [Gimesia panareensis]|nr:hypothetical protein Pan110_18080 [Gimesia panareensis]